MNTMAWSHGRTYTKSLTHDKTTQSQYKGLCKLCLLPKKPSLQLARTKTQVMENVGKMKVHYYPIFKGPKDHSMRDLALKFAARINCP